jgi:phosphoglycolate phosphatase-like HAD superfamily hydrolase
MTPTVLLFDIDGTLVTTGGVGRRALAQAFDRAYGRKDACSHFSFDGMTDRAIARQGLEAVGVECTPERVEAVLALYVQMLEAEVAVADMRRYLVHVGILEALAAAETRAGFALGLGTGNIREGARVKLQRVGLHERFRFGGFGCDHEDRPTLIRHGAERGAALLGAPLEACRVVIIGDTPKDVDAAKALGAESIGVGTGGFKAEALLAHGATWAFPDLSQPGALEVLLEGRG